jgi:hypothetical protein
MSVLYTELLFSRSGTGSAVRPTAAWPSIVLTSATIYFMFWVAAKIFRVGILSYGKRPTIPELWRWLKVA